MAVQSAVLAQLTLDTVERAGGGGRRGPGAAAVLGRDDHAAAGQRRAVRADGHARRRGRARDPAQLRRRPAGHVLCLPGAAPVGGGDDHRGAAGAGGGSGPATPTAQQRWRWHTTPRRAVRCRGERVGRRTRGVPLGSPRTRGAGVAAGCPVSAQPDAVTATARRRRRQAAAGSPGTPLSRHGARKHGATTIAVGGVFSRAPLGTLAPVDWVDLLIIGLMLLAAVHGLRLGRPRPDPHLRRFLPRFLPRGRWSGCPCCGRVTTTSPAPSSSSALVLFTACALGVCRAGPRDLEQRQPCAGTTWATSTPCSAWGWPSWPCCSRRGWWPPSSPRPTAASRRSMPR